MASPSVALGKRRLEEAEAGASGARAAPALARLAALALEEGEAVHLHVSHVRLHIGTFACGEGALYVTSE